jgi:integrase
VQGETKTEVKAKLRDLRRDLDSGVRPSATYTVGAALEDIADLVGHRGTATTETVYRKVIVPELRRGAEVMDRLFT